MRSSSYDATCVCCLREICSRRPVRSAGFREPIHILPAHAINRTAANVIAITNSTRSILRAMLATKHVRRQLQAGNFKPVGKLGANAHGNKFAQDFAFGADTSFVKLEDVLYRYGLALHA